MNKSRPQKNVLQVHFQCVYICWSLVQNEKHVVSCIKTINNQDDFPAFIFVQ